MFSAFEYSVQFRFRYIRFMFFRFLSLGSIQEPKENRYCSVSDTIRFGQLNRESIRNRNISDIFLIAVLKYLNNQNIMVFWIFQILLGILRIFQSIFGYFKLLQFESIQFWFGYSNIFDYLNFFFFEYPWVCYLFDYGSFSSEV